jgi:hypothetical protein
MLDINAMGVLTFTGANVNNTLTVSLASDTYTVDDPLDQITLGPGALGAGWTPGGGASTVMGPANSVSSMNITLGTSVNTLDLGPFNYTVATPQTTPMTITGGGNTSSTANVTGGGSGIIAPGLVSITGFGTITVNDPISSTGVALTADTMNINNTINGGTGNVTLLPLTASQTIDVGGLGSGTRLVLSTNALQSDVTTTGILQIGDSAVDTGTLEVTDAINGTGQWGTLSLQTGGSVTEPGGSLTVTNLDARGAAGVALDNATGNGVTNLTGRTTTSGALFNLINANDLNVAASFGLGGITSAGDLTLCVLAGNITLSAPINAAGNTIGLSAPAGGISQIAPVDQISAGNLGVRAGGNVALDVATNQLSNAPFANFAAGTTGSAFVHFKNAGSFTVGIVGAVGCFTPGQTGITTAGNPVTLTVANVGGTLTIADGIDTTGGLAIGGDISLIANNLSLTSTVNAGSGTVNLEPATINRTIDLGGLGSGARLVLLQSDLQKVLTTGVLQIGDLVSYSGTIEVTAAISGSGATWDRLFLQTSGTITEPPPGTLTVTNLEAEGGSGVTLDNPAGNSVTNLIGATTVSGALFNFINAITLNVVPAVGPGIGGIISAGDIAICTTGDIDITGVLTAAGTVGLSATGHVSQTATGVISAMNLGVIAGTFINLEQAQNLVTGSFAADTSNTPGGTAMFFEDASPSGFAVGVVGATGCFPGLMDITTGTGAAADVRLTSDAISIPSPRFIHASTNRVTLQPFGNTGTIDLGGMGTGARLILLQNDLAQIVAGTLQIGNLTGYHGLIEVTNAIAGSLTTWEVLSLQTGGAGATAGTITEPGTMPGNLTVTNLAAQGDGGVSLNRVLGNSVTNLAGATTNSGALFNFTNATALTVNSVDGVTSISSGGDLTLCAMAGNLTLDIPLTATGNTVGLSAAGAVNEALAAAVLTASNLGVIAGGPVSLDTPTNQVSSRFAVNASGAGALVSFKNGPSFAVNTVGGTGCFAGISGGSTSGGDLALCTGGSLTLGTTLSAAGHTVGLSAGGLITQAAAGTITAANLGAVTTGGNITLDQATNMVSSTFKGVAPATFNVSFKNGPGFTWTDVGGTGCFPGTSGSNGGGSDKALCTGGSLMLSSPLSGATVGLMAAGNVTQTAAAGISATNLGVRAGGLIDLEAASNQVTTNFAATTSPGGSTIRFRNASSFMVASVGSIGCFTTAVVGVTSGGGSDITICNTVGDLTILQPINAGAGNVRLASAGAITQSMNGLITAGNLGVTAAGTIALDLLTGGNTNQIANQFAVNDTGASAAVRFRNTGSITIGTVTQDPPCFPMDVMGVTTNNGAFTITLGSATTTGNLVVNQPINVMPAGTVLINFSGAATFNDVQVTAASAMLAGEPALNSLTMTYAAGTTFNLTGVGSGNVMNTKINVPGGIQFTQVQTFNGGVGSGNDTFNVGTSGNPLSGVLGPMTVSLNELGGSPRGKVNFFDDGDSTQRIYTLDTSNDHHAIFTLQGVGMATADSIHTFDVTTGNFVPAGASPGNEIDVASTVAAGVTTFHAKGSHTTIRAGSSGTLDNIRNKLDLDGGTTAGVPITVTRSCAGFNFSLNATNRLDLLDQTNPVAKNYLLDFNLVGSLQNRNADPIDFINFQYVTLQTGTGANAVTVNHTPNDTFTQIVDNGNGDTLHLNDYGTGTTPNSHDLPEIIARPGNHAIDVLLNAPRFADPATQAFITISADPGANVTQTFSNFDNTRFRFKSTGVRQGEIDFIPTGRPVLCFSNITNLAQATFQADAFLLPSLDSFNRPNFEIFIQAVTDHPFFSSVRVGTNPFAPVVAQASTISPFGFSPPTIAIADVNGDGIPDLIVALGSSFVPLVTVFDGASILSNTSNNPTMLAQFFAYDSMFPGGVFLAAGNLNVPGASGAAIVTGAGRGGGPHVKVFTLDSPPTFNPNIFPGGGVTLRDQFFAYDPNFFGGVRVATGNVDPAHPTETDIVTGAGPGGGPHVKAFEVPSNTVVQSFMAYDSSFRGGVFVAAGQYDSSPITNPHGLDQILTGQGFGGPPLIRIFDPTMVAAPRVEFLAFTPRNLQDNALTAGVSSVAFNDNPADDLLDVVVGSGVGQTAEVRVFANPLSPANHTPDPSTDTGFLANMNANNSTPLPPHGALPSGLIRAGVWVAGKAVRNTPLPRM